MTALRLPTDGVHLRDVSTTLNAHMDIDRGEGHFTEDEDCLADLEAQDLGLEDLDGRADDLYKDFTLTGVGNRSCSL